MLSLSERTKRAVKIIKVLEKKTASMPKPMSWQIVDLYGRDAYLIFISCLLSLRSRDPITFEVSKELFKKAKTPQQMVKLPIPEIEKIIHKVNFYKRKGRLLHSASLDLINRFNGAVPSNKEDLLSIKGVGQKTANLVLSVAFDIPAICVDTLRAPTR